MYNVSELAKSFPLVEKIAAGEEIVWINPDKTDYASSVQGLDISMDDINDAEARLARFAPFIMKCFPETIDRGGIIESVTADIENMRNLMNEKYGCDISGKLLLKQDSHLAVAGSVKARGGIYEVLKHTEELAIEAGIITEDSDYSILAEPENRKFFEQYTVQVGSTGNLGLSIGIASAAVGYTVIVHMSADAKQWKKDLLRSHGVIVKEYESDYSEAVKQGRALSDADPKSYFVDDENSVNLFMGYAVAAKRLVGQLDELNVTVDADHPLFVYIPCGVGGAPGGIAFGLKEMYQDNVHVFFIEPTQAPCMVLGMGTGLNNGISVKDIGLSGLTDADGLAVGRPSGFVGGVMKGMLSGEVTIRDFRLYDYMRDLLDTEDIFIEPSSCAAFHGPAMLGKSPELEKYIADNGLTDKMANAAHIAWATGGRLVPEEIREEYKNTHLEDK